MKISKKIKSLFIALFITLLINSCGEVSNNNAKENLRTLILNCNNSSSSSSAECNKVVNYDTSNITDMSNLFNEFKYNIDISHWNTAKVTNMSHMFYKARNFNSPLESWNTSKVTNMSYMFYEARAFNQPLNSWNTSNVTKMNGMF